ncbi:MAG: hypothetical protein ABUK13_02750 [Gammaproteobacteria bacterium]
MGLAATAIANGDDSENGALTDENDTLYSRAAIESARVKIEAVPGSGKIRGVWLFNNKKYAFRDNAAGTNCIMWESSSTGWQEIDLGAYTDFSAGTDSADIGFVVGEEVRGGSSSSTGTIVAVVKTGGSWVAGTATGRVYVRSVSGVPFPVEVFTGQTSGTYATSSGKQPITLLPGGRYEFVNENFYGHSSLKAMFGCDGVNNGFMFSANGFQLIVTGMVDDAPIHVAEHKKHLFFAFPGGSVQHSSIGNPAEWSPITGAAEIATGDEITAFVTLPGDTLGVMNRNRLYILYGTSAANWNLIEHSDESGAIEWTVQRIGKPVYFDDRGLMDFKAVQDYGDFKNASFSEKISKTLRANKNNVLSSIRIRDKNQYRLFFDNNTFVVCSFEDRKLSGFTICEYPIPVECTASVEDSDGNEVLLFGCDNGYVYQMDKGTSFDGAAVDAFVRLAFNFMGSAERNKKFFKAVFEVTAGEASQISFTPDFDYGETEDVSQDIDVTASGGVWDVSNWDSFIWGDQLISNPIAYIDGSGQNIGITLFSSTTYEQPHTLNSVIIHYSNKGVKR